MEQLLLNNHTPQTTVSIILQQLRLWRGDDYGIPSPGCSTLQAVVVAQTLIGWKAFMEGDIYLWSGGHMCQHSYQKTQSTVMECNSSKTAMVDSV